MQNHPFGNAVTRPDDDFRLTAFAMNVIDLETFLVFDMFLTGEGIYAFYERLPFGRGLQLGHYLACSFAKRVADNQPGQLHKLGVSYDKTHHRVTWSVDGQVVQTANNPGLPIDRADMILDHGGTPTQVSLNQINCGMGLFAWLMPDNNRAWSDCLQRRIFTIKPPWGNRSCRASWIARAWMEAVCLVRERNFWSKNTTSPIGLRGLLGTVASRPNVAVARLLHFWKHRIQVRIQVPDPIAALSASSLKKQTQFPVAFEQFRVVPTDTVDSGLTGTTYPQTHQKTKQPPQSAAR